MQSSMIYSMGTALDRARVNGIPVEVLVAGAWLEGQVVGSDGHGVILAASQGEHSVVRLDSIQAVRVLAPMPGHSHIPAQMQPFVG